MQIYLITADLFDIMMAGAIHHLERSVFYHKRNLPTITLSKYHYKIHLANAFVQIFAII